MSKITIEELGVNPDTVRRRVLSLRQLTDEGLIIAVSVKGLSKLTRRTRAGEVGELADSARKELQTRGVTYTLPKEARRLTSTAERIRQNADQHGFALAGLARGERWFSTRPDEKLANDDYPDGMSSADLWWEKHQELVARFEEQKQALIENLGQYRDELEKVYWRIAYENWGSLWGVVDEFETETITVDGVVYYDNLAEGDRFVENQVAYAMSQVPTAEEIRQGFTVTVTPSLYLLPADWQEERARAEEARVRRTAVKQMVIDELRQRLTDEDDNPFVEVENALREMLGKAATEIAALIQTNGYLTGPSSRRLADVLSQYRRLNTGADRELGRMVLRLTQLYDNRNDTSGDPRDDARMDLLRIALENLADHLGADQPIIPATSAITFKVKSTTELTDDGRRRIKDLMSQGEKIRAIKFYRELTGADLKTAKEAVEAIALGMSRRPRRRKDDDIPVLDF